MSPPFDSINICPPTHSNMYVENLNTGIFQYSIYFDKPSNSKLKQKIIHLIRNNVCDDNFIVFSNETDAQPPKNAKTKTVRFDLKAKVHLMCAWNFAYAEARKDVWQQTAIDRVRFKERINELNKILTLFC